ncbi:MAG TPA: hypothetical protein VK348_16005, partial [Planctomycetota bacterium]|nr:hypothetical protein [Planctomycetota bacterium]
NWVRQYQAPSSYRFGASMVYDSLRDRIVVFGGVTTIFGSGYTLLADTQEFDGFRTVTMSPTSSPPAGAQTAVYDTVRRRMLLVAGPAVMTTWEWDGVNWTLLATGGPSPRLQPQFAFDSIRGKAVLFGGADNLNWANRLQDTWEWDGSSWTQVAGGGPPPRSRGAMSFDPQRGRSVLHGGEGSTSGFFGDTWEWDGSTWMQMATAGPGPRITHAMTWNGSRGRTVLFGGVEQAVGYRSDTWEWDGTAWSLLDSGRPGPTPAAGPALAFDSARDRLIKCGGADTSGSYDASWCLTTLVPQAAAFVQYAASCSGPHGHLALSTVSNAPAIGTSFPVWVNSLPDPVAGPAFLFFGFDTAQWNGTPLPLSLDPFGAPGCLVHAAPIASVPMSVGPGGGYANIAVPWDGNLLGLTFYLQVGAVIPGFNAAGFVLGDSFRAQIGL